ncbi:MAG: ISL3 family transposase, partial [Chloroflexota bacterium]|nr:ISL3 family transposase [Chloroflexota bacterium]
MRMNAWFAIPQQLHVEAVTFERGGVTVLTSTQEPEAKCPACRYLSRRLHSRYHRTIADLSWGGVSVRFFVRVRKLYCDNSNWPRKIFAERLEEVAHRYARRTNRQRGTLEDIGFALGGEAGARLAVALGLPTSPDTVLRFTKQATGVQDEPVRVLGIDDWCWKRRLRYGTILVDLERHRVVDLLPDREMESVVDWLRQHPEVEIIVRDRGDTYTEAAGKGAPQAVQVVDRWHVLKNLIAYLERFLLYHTRFLKEAARSLEGIQSIEQPPAQRPTPRLEQAAAASIEKHARYVGAWEEVHRLREAGADVADIARTVGVSRRTAYRYLGMRDPPERKRPKPRCKLLDPYKEYLVRRWEEGCHNRMRLFREIQEQGYGYSETNVFRFFSELRRAQGSSNGQD